jgi:hypothetical protein
MAFISLLALLAWVPLLRPLQPALNSTISMPVALRNSPLSNPLLPLSLESTLRRLK